MQALLGGSPIHLHEPFPVPFFGLAKPDYMVGWGYHIDARYARLIARLRGLNFLHLEDGFLRSIGLGVNQSPALSIVIDDIGMYYDARRPSRLELILSGTKRDYPDLPPFSALRRNARQETDDPLEDPNLIDRARRCIDRLVHHRLSKYNDGNYVDLGNRTRPRVLVVDQTAGDRSIRYGLAGAHSFAEMLQCAIDENPDAEVIVKVHPDVMAGKKSGHLLDAGTKDRVRLLAAPANPIGLCEQVDHVYVVTSQFGFEALLAGTPVTCFGAPFYSGWGLTTDKVRVGRRRRKLSVEQVFAAAYMLYAHYQLPDVDDEAVEIEQVCDYLIQHMGSILAHDGTRRHGPGQG